MRATFVLLLLMLLISSCKNERKNWADNLLVEVEGNFLYKEELESALPRGLSAEDSLQFVEKYIRSWVENLLFFDKAESNIPDTKEVETLVENYRKALIVHSYQQALINQRLSSTVSEQEVIDFYEANKDMFIVDRPLIKGVYLKVPLTAPQINNVRRWYKTETHEAIEHLEKYSFQYAVTYDYFYDKWIQMSDVSGKMPLKTENVESFIDKNRNVELKDTAFYYFLNVTELRKAGEHKPFDFARLEAKEMLLNLRKVDFIKDIKEELYQEAVKRNKIIYNDKE
ncbi:peptidyl-prolyl cis-trans isomerase [Bacteroides sp. 214]|uniref:peptidylprolyl isomerase n=1 Tax=Bacteroides sp. 214 TaxID=2302935 RepID=UPI0013D6D8BC|nr:peptidylprolyl isomerase [Bacteroides sp. 214]NDW13106.1 peptidyl-prolyl cis-trans isomerase [Bacteroides sp. 214]